MKEDIFFMKIKYYNKQLSLIVGKFSRGERGVKNYKISNYFRLQVETK